MRKMVILAVFMGMLSYPAAASVPAFPGAEGMGMYSVGGRGGVVIEVTNLNDSGEGSFRAACTASGPRTVVFRVSGTIDVLSRINVLNPYITIAGQTAPGDGICLRGGEMMIRTHNVIVRYMRFRGSPADSLNVMYGANNVIIDHCSISWGSDENGSFYGNTNVTIQWCMIGECRYDHSCGGLWGSSSTYHHNLIYSNGTRNPKFAYTQGDAAADFRNNAIYNWGYQSSNAGDVGNVNMVANYYEYGPGTDAGTARYRILGDGGADLHIYAADNYVWSYPTITADNWAGGIQAVCIRSYVPFDAPSITQQTAQVARQYVVGSAGASIKRDSADLRFINEMLTRTYSFAGVKNGKLYPGIPDATMVIDWPTLSSLPAPLDSDHDGMPDAWEISKGLNSNDSADRNNYTLDPSYTNLEVYLNSLCPDPYAPTPNPMAFANAPYGTSTTSIAMSASAASDPYGVEYYFTNLTVPDGSHDSGWQDSTFYVDNNLAPMTTYTYTVKARSKGGIKPVTIISAQASASTDVPPDHDAPEPDPMTWVVQPSAIGIDSITMTATAAVDRSGVQYFFANLNDPNHDSGWQDSPTYIDTGLINNTEYIYRVKARDLSPSQNQTQWSADANATTFRYRCEEPYISDLNTDCRIDLLDLAMLVVQWGQTPELLDLMVNGSFDSDISGWQFLPPFVTDGPVTASFDPVIGNPAGSARLNADTASAATNSAKFYQIIHVTPGRNYKLSGDWMGNIKGTVGTVANARNWAEIFVAFVADGSVAPTQWGTIMYKKSFGGVNQNIGPTGAWSWEPITASATDGPVDGVFTATDDYMVVAVNLGGRINSGQTFVNIDNFEVVETTPCSPFDLNGDCLLDMLDIAQFASDYLSCGRYPATECWQ